MIDLVIAAFAIGVTAILIVDGKRVCRALLKYGGRMVVTCPETNETVAIKANRRHLVSTAVMGRGEVEIADCTRWPEHSSCEQRCLVDVLSHPGDCLVRTRLRDWYRNRSCVVCGRSFNNVPSYDHEPVFTYDAKPAMRSPLGEYVKWKDLQIETLPDVLESHEPVCRDCYFAQTGEIDPNAMYERSMIRYWHF